MDFVKAVCRMQEWLLSFAASGSTQFVKVKKIFRQKNRIFCENHNPTPIYITMDYPKFTVSNQKEESIPIQRV